jgi:hypothetical protein
MSKKRLTKFAIHKRFDSKQADSGCFWRAQAGSGRKKEKREQAPPLYTQLSTASSIAEDRRKSREIFEGSVPDLHFARGTNEGRRRLIVFLRAQGIEI